MDVRIIVETTFENGTKRSHRLDSISRPARQVGPENFGLMMKDSQSLLCGIQEAVLRDQIEGNIGSEQDLPRLQQSQSHP